MNQHVLTDKVDWGLIFAVIIFTIFCSLSAISGNLILALNQEYLERDSENIRLNAGDEIAVIPPISGG